MTVTPPSIPNRPWFNSPLLEVIFKILAGVSIPLCLWALDLHKQNAIQDMQIANMIEQNKRVDVDIKQLDQKINTVNIAINRLEVKLDGINERLSDIRQKVSDNNHTRE